MFAKAGMGYTRCGRCGFRFATPGANANLDNALSDFESAYRQYLEPGPMDRVNHQAVLSWLERFCPLREGTRLLDVGAGSGKWLAYVTASRGVRAEGVEPSAALYREYALDRLNVAHATLPEFVGRTDHRFDVITAFDVVEHVREPQEFARALADLTVPGGFVFLSTPDAGSALARLMGRYWHHYNRYHLSLFGPRTIRRLGDAVGFRTLALTHRSKRVPLSYLRAYVTDFLIGRAPSATLVQAEGSGVSMNLFDIMSVVWQRDSGHRPARSSRGQ